MSLKVSHDTRLIGNRAAISNLGSHHIYATKDKAAPLLGEKRIRRAARKRI